MGQSASVESTVYETINAAVNTTLKSTVDASANAQCDNIQRVEDVQCCTIKFSEQTCEASAINEVISAGRLDTQVTQGIASAIQQSGEASTEGLAGAIYAGSDVNNFVWRTTDIAINTTQTFETDCSKNATGLNEQSVKNAYCGCGEDAPENRGTNIEFAPQTITLEALGTCVSDIVGSSAAAQDYQSIVGQKGTASVTGVNLLELFLAMIGPLMIFIIAPVGFKILTSPTKKPKEELSASQTAALTGQRVGKFSFMAIFFFAVFWWPGLAAWLIGAPPFYDRRSPELDLNLCTPEGESRTKDLVVNRYQWYDPDCISKEAGESCSTEDQYKSYNTCGIFAKADFCNDPKFGTDKTGFRDMQAACAEITSLWSNRQIDVGDVPSIASVTMQNKTNSYGKQCRICFSNDPTLRLKNGLYSNIDTDRLNDPDDTVCKFDKLKAPPAECYLPCDGISDTAYMAAGIDASGQPFACDSNDFECFQDEQLYKNASPGECLEPAYQQAKKKVSQKFRKVQEAESIHRAKFATPEEPLDGRIELGEMCQPKPFDWLNCNADFSCNYTPQDPNNIDEVRACSNDFTDCQDPAYLLDKIAQDAVEDKCKEDAETDKSQERFLNAIPIFTIGFYLVMMVFTFVAYIYGSRLSTQVALDKDGRVIMPDVDPSVNKLYGSDKYLVPFGVAKGTQWILLFITLAGLGTGIGFIATGTVNTVSIAVTAVSGVLFLMVASASFAGRRAALANPAAAQVYRR